jgi:hypothetical protein
VLEDLLNQLSEMGVVVAWVADMAWSALWLPHECVMVLNASEGRDSLAREVIEFLGDDRALRS